MSGTSAQNCIFWRKKSPRTPLKPCLPAPRSAKSRKFEFVAASSIVTMFCAASKRATLKFFSPKSCATSPLKSATPSNVRTRGERRATLRLWKNSPLRRKITLASVSVAFAEGIANHRVVTNSPPATSSNAGSASSVAGILPELLRGSPSRSSISKPIFWWVLVISVTLNGCPSATLAGMWATSTLIWRGRAISSARLLAMGAPFSSKAGAKFSWSAGFKFEFAAPFAPFAFCPAV